MPSSACLKCHRLIPLGATYCRAHTPAKKPRNRVGPRQRGLTYEYEKNRAIVLRVSTLCVLCGKEGANSADHVKPRIYGIDNTLPNLVPAHLSCNSSRQDKPMNDEQKQRVAIFLHYLDTYCNANGIAVS